MGCRPALTRFSEFSRPNTSNGFPICRSITGNCPQCQYHKTRDWIGKQLNKLVPGHHFMITFTVLEEIRPIIRRNRKAAYRALFKASSQALKKLAADERFVGTNLPGFTGVLHTWGRQLQYHPRI
ncbi:MAG: transposase, partial [Proteobacteria bacterium]|nr:transposase [Pseudomonadota bacterium]